MNVVGVVLWVLFLLLFLLVMGGAVLLGLERSNRRYAAKSKEQEGSVEAFVRKEEGLAERDAASIMRDAPRAGERRRRSDELAEGARKRIRHRARSVLSGDSGAGGAAGG